MQMCRMWYYKDKVRKKATGKRISPFEGTGLLGDIANTGTELFLTKGVPYLGKKAVEMGRYFGSELMRDPKLQKKAIDYGLRKMNPLLHKVGSEALDQLSTKIRPKKKYTTNRKDLDGGALDIHKAIGKLPKPKKGWTLPGHHYTGPYNDLENQLKYDPKNWSNIINIRYTDWKN